MTIFGDPAVFSNIPKILNQFVFQQLRIFGKWRPLPGGKRHPAAHRLEANAIPPPTSAHQRPTAKIVLILVQRLGALICNYERCTSLRSPGLPSFRAWFCMRRKNRGFPRNWIWVICSIPCTPRPVFRPRLFWFEVA